MSCLDRLRWRCHSQPERAIAPRGAIRAFWRSYCPARGNTLRCAAILPLRGAIRRAFCTPPAAAADPQVSFPCATLARIVQWSCDHRVCRRDRFIHRIAPRFALSSAFHIVYRSLPQRRCHDEISHNCFFALLCALCDASMGAKQCTRPDPLRSFRSPWRRHTGTIQTHRQHNAQRRQRQDLQLRSSPYHSIFRRDSFGRLSAHTVVASRRHLFMPIRHHG